MKPKVLFVCVENSCRSQIADGFARTLGKGVIDAWSAGSKPSGIINPKAIESMKQRGIDLGAHLSKGLNDLPEVKWDYVITMGCGDACPFVPSTLKEDWGIPDPKTLPLDEFGKIRDQIENKVKNLITHVQQQKSQVAR